MEKPDPDISIIVPTLNEAENIPELLRRLEAVLAQKKYEVLIVDDNSRDNTVQLCEQLAAKYPVKVLVRTQPKNGLSGAVLHGMSHAAGATLVVMDADLQHPPEQVPLLLDGLENGADFVIGSRYVAGGSTERGWGFLRKVNSKAATLLARPLIRRITDPMSGFFALRRETYERGQRLAPLGYKVGLELICKCGVKQVSEVPINFGNRTRGESKLNFKQQFKYVEHLSRLYDFSYPRLSPVAKFLIVIALGWLPGLAIYFAMTRLHVVPPVAAGIAYLGSILVTATFHARYVRTQTEFLVTATPWFDFTLISLAELIGCVLSAQWLDANLANPNSFSVPVLSFLAATVVRYVLRKELMQDIRGLRRDLRWELIAPAATHGDQPPCAAPANAVAAQGFESVKN